MLNRPHHPLLHQSGVSSIEYALLSVLVLLVALGAAASTGEAVWGLWSDLVQQLAAAIG